ncbi:MAG: isocitrate/isopropylmalate dehydrogenase family protein [Myxococcales bacterium]|nr:isocitrate/isopropylmalate dehydrogenase family protein [Myxococcales bacterium]
MTKSKRVAVLPGDGIGVDVLREAVRLLEAIDKKRPLSLDLWHLDLGADRYLRDKTTLPKETFEEVRDTCGAILLGALGDPRVPGLEHARDILFGFRFGLELYANVRTVKCLHDKLCPLKAKPASAVNFTVFRENTEGVYVGVGGQVRKGTPDEIAINEDINTRKGVERILRAAFDFAKEHGKTRVHMADKSNAMKHAHELWYRAFFELAKEYPGIEARHVYVDALCLYMIQEPENLQVIVTNNLFGDIVTDLGAALQGGLGMAPSGNINWARRGPALFEPVHGSAPPLAGKDLANPFASALTVGMMLDYLGYAGIESAIEDSVRDCVVAEECTRDVGGSLGTRASMDKLIARVSDRL